jgi:hypothetical protein
MRREKMVYRIEVDISGDDFEFNWKWLGGYINRGMRIAHYIHFGPAGGNPCLKLEFPADGLLLQDFMSEYDPEDLTFEEFLDQYGIK